MKVLIDEVTFFASDPGNSPTNLDEALTAALRTNSTRDSRREGRDKDPEKKPGYKDTSHSHREPAAGPGGNGCSQQNEENPGYQHFPPSLLIGLLIGHLNRPVPGIFIPPANFPRNSPDLPGAQDDTQQVEDKNNLEENDQQKRTRETYPRGVGKALPS